MCGIVGYVGPKAAAPILLEGLRRLEYRGYDSAGLAVHDGSKIGVVRAVGKLENLANAIRAQAPSGTTGIGHTRWATHGRPSEPNAHPHVAGGVGVVHNGIIENHLELKRQLASDGVEFKSDTDTEIVAHLIHRALPKSSSLMAAVRAALLQLRGAYSIAVVAEDSPSLIVVAKQASPLVVGVTEGAALCASDVPALLAHTRDMLFLEDGDLAELSASGVHVETLQGARVERAKRRIDWSPVQAEKGGYKHYMQKEIHEQPRAIEDTLRGRIDLESGDINGVELGLDAVDVNAFDRVHFLACGTSFHASLVGRYWVEQLARLPAHAELGSEVRYREPVFTKRDLVVAVSQSGETADTLAAVQSAKEAGATVVAVVNVLESAIPRAAGNALYTHAGPEVGVASTKCFVTQLAALLMLSVYLGRRRGTLSSDAARKILQALVEVPNDMRQILADTSEIEAIARRWVHADHMLFLGRGLQYPIALEGALKLKEISYAHAEGYAAGEMKHGPIALIDENMPVVVVMPKDQQYDKTFANMQEVRARDGQVIAVATRGDGQVEEFSDNVLWLPDVPSVVVPLLSVVPLQLLSYHIADFKGTDVDQPRNLAKTVTVE